MLANAKPAPHAIPLFMSEIEAMGGAERSILALGRWLHAHCKPVYLLTYYDRVGLAQHADFPLPTIALNPANNVRAKTAALRQHFRAQPHTAPPPITSGYQPALHCALARTGRFHCLMHDTPSLFGGHTRSLKQRLRFAVSNWQIGRAMRRNRGVMIVTSQFLQEECRRDFHLQAEIARMGGLAQQHAFRPRPVIPTQPEPPGNAQRQHEGPTPANAKRLNLLSVSRIEANKRIDWMLDALATLEGGDAPLSQRADWRLDLAGKGSQLESMTARAHQLGLGSRVHFHGFVRDGELETLYDQAHLFLMPAVQGYGIPAIEALQRGIPVLLHRDSGVSDILLDTPWATVLTDGKEELAPRLAAMIDWLLANQHLAAPRPPDLPTEDAWAERVATLCGYV